MASFNIAEPFSNTDKLPGGQPQSTTTVAPPTGDKLEDRLKSIMDIITGSGSSDQAGAPAPDPSAAPTSVAPVGHLSAVSSSPNGGLNASAIYQTALSAGFSSQQAIIMTAIALAESGGRPDAHNGNAGTGDNSYGLWQINMLGNMGPQRLKQFGLSSNDQLFDPGVNAMAAFQVSGGGANFSPWTTYTSGAYKRYLAEAQAAAQAG